MTRKELIEKLLKLGGDDTPVAFDDGWSYVKLADPWLEHYVRVRGMEPERAGARFGDCIAIGVEDNEC